MFISGKGKGKAHVTHEPPPLVMETPSSPSLEALLADSTLFEEPSLKDLEEEVMAKTTAVYGAEVTKKVLDLLRDYTPFQMVASITLMLCLIYKF